MSKIQVANRKSPTSMGLLTCSRDFLSSLTFLGGKIMRLGLEWHKHTGFGNVPSLWSHQLTEQKLPMVCPHFLPLPIQNLRLVPKPPSQDIVWGCGKNASHSSTRLGRKIPSVLHLFTRSFIHPVSKHYYCPLCSKHSAARMPCKILSGHQSGNCLRTSLKWTLLIRTSDRK